MRPPPWPPTSSVEEDPAVGMVNEHGPPSNDDDFLSSTDPSHLGPHLHHDYASSDTTASGPLHFLTSPSLADVPMTHDDNNLSSGITAESIETASSPSGDDHEMTDVEEESVTGFDPLHLEASSDPATHPAFSPHVPVAGISVDADSFLEPEHELPPLPQSNPAHHQSQTGATPTLPQTPPPNLLQITPAPAMQAEPGPPPHHTAIYQFTHEQLQFQIQQQVQQQILNANLNDEADEEWAGLQTVFSNPNPMSLAPENFGLVDFLRAWSLSGRGPTGTPRDMSRVPAIRQVMSQARDNSVARVDYSSLKGEDCDLQGIDWTDIGVSRNMARQRRLATYKNYVNKPGSDLWRHDMQDRRPSDCENYFRFRKMDLRRDIRLLHFQLRNIMGCASRTRVFYPSHGAIKELDPTTGRTKKAMTFDSEGDVQLSTLSAEENVLVAGDFSGNYRFRSLDSESRAYTEGRLTDNVSGITNHVQVHSSRRSAGPLAAFASNDYGFRIVDLATNTIISETAYKYPLNCSAISPDRRLRVMVGDSLRVSIADAESGEILQELPGHRDFGFSCDWAPDGWTVATGFQDKTVRIWDARMWKQAVAVVRSEMSGVRSLRFSPLGSGKRLLVAAEEADFVNIIDAQTFQTKQKFDVFGELGGVSFADEGQNLMALVCDRARGGLLQLERCDAGAEDTYNYEQRRYTENLFRQKPLQRPTGYDWAPTPEMTLGRPESEETLIHRRRKAALMGNLDPF